MSKYRIGNYPTGEPQFKYFKILKHMPERIRVTGRFRRRMWFAKINARDIQYYISALDKKSGNDDFEFKEYKEPLWECPNCHKLQEHTYPMSGKFYCCECGELLDEICE